MIVNLLSFVEEPFTDSTSFNYKRFDEVVQQASRLSEIDWDPDSDNNELDIDEIEEVKE